MSQNYSKKNKEEQQKELDEVTGYQLIERWNLNMRGDNICKCIAFKGVEKLALGLCEEVLFYRFNNGVLQLEQKVAVDDEVTAMYFMEKKYELICGLLYGQLQILEMNTNQKWNCKLLIKQAHVFNFQAIIMNKNEDIMITCGNDSILKFWAYQDTPQIQQKLNVDSGLLGGLCLNESENQLISYSYEKLIISERRMDGIWRKKQRIAISIGGSLFSFIGNNLITFQLNFIHQMLLFRLDLEKDLFVFDSVIKMEFSISSTNCKNWQIFNKKNKSFLQQTYQMLSYFRENSRINQFLNKKLNLKVNSFKQQFQKTVNIQQFGTMKWIHQKLENISEINYILKKKILNSVDIDFFFYIIAKMQQIDTLFSIHKQYVPQNDFYVILLFLG